MNFNRRQYYGNIIGCFGFGFFGLAGACTIASDLQREGASLPPDTRGYAILIVVVMLAFAIVGPCAGVQLIRKGPSE
jgi:hypothetical protein